MRQLPLICAAFLLPWATPAWSDSASTATVWNTTATLIDLDPNDGITPAITYNTGSTYNASAGSSVYVFAPNQPAYSSQSNGLATTKFGPVSTDNTGPQIFATAGVSGDGTMGGSVLTASGSALSEPGVESSYFASSTILRDTSDAYSAQSFTLTPNTEVIFTAMANLTTTFTPPIGKPDSDGHDNATAYAQLLVFDQGSDFSPGPRLQDDQVTAQMDTEQVLNPSEYDLLNQNLSVSFTNDTTGWLSGAVGVMAGVNGQASYVPSLVPEPASWTLLGLGLAIMGVRRIRFATQDS